MSADPLPATLSFLTDAAHLLLLASPETSAHLMSQRNSLMFNSGLDQSDVQRQHACGCCGHIMIAGHGDSFKMESGKMARRKKTAPSKKRKAEEGPPRSGCRKTLTCGKCGRYTRIQLPPPCIFHHDDNDDDNYNDYENNSNSNSISTATTTNISTRIF
ncbi:hypothetical protein F5B18DRAFT_649332 [Nemania serpens]|nr:hypothetical protein F5B18DRAFT_649332 [Nemania serpens]